MIFVLKCCGPARVGIFSGGQPHTPKPEGGSQEQLEAWQATIAAQERRLKRSRIAVLLCSLGITICVILMIVMGVQSLVGATDDTLDTVSAGQSLANQAAALVDDYLQLKEAAVAAVRSFRQNANGICPNVRDEICTNVDIANVCNFTNIPYGDELQRTFSAVVI